MMASAGNKAALRRPDVFISYSRKDREFVKRLEAALQARGREAWVDWEGIRPAEEFMQAIFPAIEGADTFVFVISPESVVSDVCGRELAHAATHNKRMIPIMARDVDAKAVPEPLAKLNWVFFCRENDNFDVGTETLISALDTDLEWVHAHTRLLTRAIEWEAKGQSNSFVLRGEDLRAAEQWLAQAGSDKERQPTALQTEYIIASRKASSKRQRITLGAVSFGLVLAIVLAILAVVQERKAKNEASHSEYLRALSLVDDGDSDQALRTLARSLELAPANSLAATRLINLLGQRQWPHLAAKQKSDLPIGMIQKNGDASRIIIATQSAGEGMHMDPQVIHLYDAENLGAGKTVHLESYEITDMRVSGDRVLVTGARPYVALLLDAKTGDQVKAWQADQSTDRFDGRFSSDGQCALGWSEDGLSGTFRGVKLEIVSAATGELRFPILHLAQKVRTMTMKGAELRILFNDGSVAIQALENGKAVQVRPFPVVKDLPEFAAFASDGTLVLGVSKNGIKCWPVSPLGKNDLDIFEASAKGLTQFQLDAFNPLHKISDAFQSGAYPLTIMAQDPRSPSASARSCVIQLARDQESKLQIKADWHSPFAPICPLSPGIMVVQDSKAFVLPFHGGSLSGPLRHEAAITAICGIREGLVATGSADGAVRLWNLTRPAFPAQLQSRPAAENEGALLLKSQSHDVEIRSEESGDYVIKSGAKLVKIEMPPGMSEQSISSVELSGDGQWGILSGFREDGRGGTGSGAWIFRVKDGKLLSGKVGPCEWAGFSPDRRQVLTIEFGRLTFWDLRQDANGTMTFAKTQPMLAQADMAGAGIAANGTRIATRSVNGEVIVWNKADGKPLQTLRRNPLWNDVDLDSTEPNPNEDVRAQTISCKPALNADGRLLATAYGRGFVVWDADSGKPLSDPVICAAEIRSLEFSASDSTKLSATLRDGSSTSWDHATHGGSLVKADLAVLQKLALAVANDQWVDEVPKLAADTHPALPVVAKLLEHFASQARALRGTGARSAPAVPK